MLKIPRKWSVTLSQILTVMFFALLIAGCFVMPFYVDTITDSAHFVYVLIVAYLILVCAGCADTALFALLRRVEKGEIFTDRSVALIRLISWFCILGGVLFALLAPLYLVAYPVAFTALFVGICLRVVKNAVEEATALKQENDFTI